MRAVQFHHYGGPEELRLEEIALPEPGSDQVRIRVKAAAANPMDWKIRTGEMKMMTGRKFPRGLGHDFAGVVEAVGPRVTRLKIGDEVFGATGLKKASTFAEALVADENTVFLKPRSLSFQEAAALPIVTAAAWTGLIDKAKLRPGWRVFITGCLGAVGRAAIQIARMNGADIAGSCNASGRGEAQALGVLQVVDYAASSAGAYQGQFDVVFDTHGALSLSQCGSMLRRGGVALHLVPTARKLIWSMLSPRHKMIFTKLTQQTMDGIAEAVERGDITPTIGRIVPLSEAIPAIIELEKTGLPKGKLVISPM